MRRGPLVLLLLAGCGAILPLDRSSTHAPVIETRRTYPHEVEYVLLAQTNAEACADEGELLLYRGRKSHDPEAIEPAVLYERAKYDAIVKVTGADGLVGVLAKATQKSLTTCVAVYGRAYRIDWMRASAGNTERRSSDRDRGERRNDGRSDGATLAPGE
jgi:hypothetical protein